MAHYTNVEGLARLSKCIQLSRDIQRALERLPVVVTILQEPGLTPVVDMVHVRLSATVRLRGRFSSEPPTVAWHGAKGKLRFAQATWGSTVDFFDHTKATSFPRTFNELIECLVAGFHAAEQGTAFEPGSLQESI